nr:hypothetical protein [Acutalibacter muris]
MPAINMSSIMSKVGAYSRSVSGKLRMKECIQKYAADGKSKTASGDKVMTEDEMCKAGAKLIWVLQETARSFDLPQSVMQHFNSLECSKPYRMPDGSAVMYVYFEDDLHRDSLESGEGANGYTGEGIDNIVALLNNGAHAKDYVYGWWNNHSPSGSAFARSMPNDDFAWVRSKKDRDALHFIQQAVNDFNGNYGAEYNVTAEAGEAYQQ